MDKQTAIAHLRKRLLVLLGGLLVSYLISFGLAVFLILDANVGDRPWVWAVVAGFAVMAIIHIRAQFRRYDALVRMVEEDEDFAAAGDRNQD